MKVDFLNAYIGKPWRAGARGPDAFDCWGIIRDIYKAQLSVQLPEFLGIDFKSNPVLAAKTINEQANGEDWQLIGKPENFCVVGMGLKVLTHVGIYFETDGGIIVHCADYTKVCADSPFVVKQNYRFRRLEYYRFHGFNRSR